MSSDQVPKSQPPNPIFVVFCRICGIDAMAADTFGAAQQALAGVCAGHKDKACAVHSSVYGRFLCVEKPRVAVDIATAVLDEAARRGVRLAVGIDQGRVGRVQDVGHDNLIGAPINLAARLAAMPEAVGHVVLTQRAGHAVHDAVHAYRGKLGEPKAGKVKRTEFTYYTFEHACASVGKPPPSLADEPQTVHALVYDVARFSEMDPQKAWTVLTQLRETVVDILGRCGGLAQMGAGQVWYAPAGDGGVIVFSSQVGGDTALDVAEKLVGRCHDKPEIRVGLAMGPAVIIAADLPVGPGILRADALSALPATGHICADRTWWTDRHPADKDRWTVRDHDGDEKHEKDPDALLIFPPGVEPPPPLHPPNGDIFALCPRCLAELEKLSADQDLSGFLATALRGNVVARLRAVGALQVLRDIGQSLDTDAPKPGVDKLTRVLACIAPFHVPAELVEQGRRQLGIDPGDHPRIRNGGVLAVGSDTHEDADAIIRSALLDRPCSWAQGSFTGRSWPQGDRRFNALEVPARGTIREDRVACLRQRFLEVCRAKSLSAAMAAMYEWLYDGIPLAVLCDQDTLDLLNGMGPSTHRLRDGTVLSLRDLALFLSMCAKDPTEMQGLLERLSMIFAQLSRT